MHTLLPLLLWLMPAFAADPAEAELATAFGATPPRADWLFLLETSREAKPLADAARAEIAAFVAEVPAGDTVEIVAYHTRASASLPATVVDEAGRAALVEQVRTLELTSAKDVDLGAALARAADTLGRPSAGDVQFVYVVSSFCHAPAFASEWDSGGRGCRAVRGVDRLAGMVAAGRDHRLLVTTVFPRPTSSQPVHQPGVETVRKVFDPVGEFVVADTDFATTLARVRARMAATRLGPVAAADAARLHLTAQVEQAPTPDAPRARIRLDSGLQRLALRLDDLRIEGAASSAPETLTLQPDAHFEVDVPLAPPRFSLLPQTETLELPIRISGEGTLLPPDGLRAAGIEPTRPKLAAEVTVRLSRTYGLSAPVATLLIVGTVLGVAFGTLWLRGRLAPRRLGGSFVYRRANGPRRVLDIADLDEAAIVVRPEGELGVGRTQDSVLVLRMARRLFRTHAEVEIRTTLPVEINTRPVAAGRHKIVAGATSFQFGEYRLTWE